MSGVTMTVRGLLQQIMYQNVPNLLAYLNLVIHFYFEACAVELTQFFSARWFPDRSGVVIFTLNRYQKGVKMPGLNRDEISPACWP